MKAKKFSDIEITNEEILLYMSCDAERRGDIWMTILVEYVKSGHADFLFLKNEEARDLWHRFYRKAIPVVQKHKNAMYLYPLRLSAYNKLTKEECKNLGVRKPRKPADIYRRRY